MYDMDLTVIHPSIPPLSFPLINQSSTHFTISPIIYQVRGAADALEGEKIPLSVLFCSESGHVGPALSHGLHFDRRV